MAERKIKWTSRQEQAISQLGGNITVTASAGTGKTAVLSGRCVNIISEKSICPSVSNILVLTFTDAAAEQMRSRIAGQLKAAISKKPDIHLRRQLMALDAADISTIHSFCKRLITEHFYQLALDPTFTVIDTDEQRLLKNQALEETINWAWQQNDLAAPLHQLLYGRNLNITGGFLSKIISLSNFLDTIASRDNWYSRAERLSDAVNPFATSLADKQKKIITEKLKRILSQFQSALGLYENQHTGGAWGEKLITTSIEPVRKCIEYAESDNWRLYIEFMKNFKNSRAASLKDKEIDEPIAEAIKGTVKKAKDNFTRLSNYAVLNPDYLDKLGNSANLQTKVVIKLVRKFDDFYSRIKKQFNCLDFADLEHYALKLLTKENPDDQKPLPSDTALALRSRYKYIFVDEYQDINPVQQAILDAVGSGDNIFVVGDVKQSIYAFRGAEPQILLENLKQAAADEKKDISTLRIDLNSNFRSDKGVLDFVNKLFARLMKSSITKIDYDQSAYLKAGTKEQTEHSNSPSVELHILDEETNIENYPVLYSRQRQQAALIAQRIRQIVQNSEFKIFDETLGKKRPVEYRDIAILMRSPFKKVSDYLEILRLAGIPASSANSTGYSQATEIKDCLCLLKVLDNPQRDIELAGLLRSGFFRVNDSQLAEIKVETTNGENHKNFYQRILQYSNSGGDTKLAGRLKEILNHIEKWRNIAATTSLADLIWHIFRQTNFLTFISALPNGQVRKANLLKLHDRAIQFEGFASGRQGMLTRFVEFIEKLEEAGYEWSSAEPDGLADNSVKIMSIHKSKGLEFPIVFLAELNSKFNFRDISDEILVDNLNTIGIQIINRQNNTKLASLAHQVIAEKKKTASLAEEMRILYVATTRAKNRLILTASGRRGLCRQIITEGFLFNQKTVADWQLYSSQSPFQWILYSLSNHKNLHKAFQTDFTAEVPDNHLFDIKIYGQSEVNLLSKHFDKLTDGRKRHSKPIEEKAKSKSDVLSRIKKSLGWKYKFTEAVKLPAKSSVTRLTHQADQYHIKDFKKSLQRKPKALSGNRPATDSRLIGSATHLVISALNLEKPVNEQAVNQTIESLLNNKSITEQTAGLLDKDSILSFFDSPLGKKIINVQKKWPDWQFTFALPASQWKNCPLPRDTRYEIRDTIIVQGIIDLLAQTEKSLVIVDFKTDRITAQQAAGRAQLYKTQLELYAQAAEKILKITPVEKWLYFLTPRCEIRIT